MSIKTRQLQSRFLALPISNISTSEALFEALALELSSRCIPWKNIIGYASDTANVMVGKRNSVLSRLKLRQPNVFSLGIQSIQTDVRKLLKVYLSQFMIPCILQATNDITQVDYKEGENQFFGVATHLFSEDNVETEVIDTRIEKNLYSSVRPP